MKTLASKMYFLKTPTNEWDLRKAFTDYLLTNEADECVDAMKKDLMELKSSNLLSVKMKSKCEQFLLLIDKKKREMDSASTSSNQQSVLYQYDNENVHNNFHSTVSVESSSKRSGESNASNSKRTKMSDEIEAEELFTIDKGALNLPTLPTLPTRIDDLDPEDFQIDINQPYIINNININDIFINYQKEIVDINNIVGLFVENNPHELLAIQGILLLKSNQHSSVLLKHLNHDTLRAIERDLKKKFSIDEQQFDKNILNTIIDVLKKLKKGERSTKEAAKDIYLLQSSEPKVSASDSLVLGIHNLLLNIPEQKFNGEIRENQLITSYATSMLSPMFTDPSHCQHLIWSNTKLTENSSKQPDVICRSLQGANWDGVYLVGEAKGEDQQSDKHMCLMDLIRIGSMSASLINTNLYDGILGVHIVGLQVTFYITSLVAEGMFIMMEICSLPLPRDHTELQHYITYLDDLLMVMDFSTKCVITQDKELLRTKVPNLMNTPEFTKFISYSKDRKRQCPIVYNH